MKLRNKKTGEIKDIDVRLFGTNPDRFVDSLAELNSEWEDVEEPKGKALYWMILTLEKFIENEPDDKWLDLEDCKRMLEKLKAWQQLKDKGFRFLCWGGIDITIHTTGLGRYIENGNLPNDILKDLNLLFGGEE